MTKVGTLIEWVSSSSCDWIMVEIDGEWREGGEVDIQKGDRGLVVAQNSDEGERCWIVFLFRQQVNTIYFTNETYWKTVKTLT
jgi:hypothetical protein